ncbi:hypothetical protein KOW79_006320 [Hemibagrus wyckioides]|uniref:Uncharacterized protein n=1 Tax=Hemibagrus wyckioides TaxID=337641 RepID=A0A9D3NW40_9TELE|nr:uncharacterized protein LOC131356545 [Hemibagrus wyckioides]KAG7330098.1 hypothetical protein KOW79_006320 [Hemibagrus wyckioides]
MAEEGEMEHIAPSSLNTGIEPGTLVEVKFEKNPYRTQKYLESEPKALGLTLIMLGVFVMSTTIFFPFGFNENAILKVVSSSVSIIAGSVAIAAQNLHLPRLKACLGLQVVGCVASLLTFLDMGGMGQYHSNICWEEHLNGTSESEMCSRIWSITEHVAGIELLVQATQFALSATLAAFCCKVIHCCSPKRNVPVVVVNTPPAPQ